MDAVMDGENWEEQERWLRAEVALLKALRGAGADCACSQYQQNAKHRVRTDQQQATRCGCPR